MKTQNKITLWGEPTIALSRIWICGHCGVKVFYGKAVARPQHGCYCGKVSWWC